MDTNSPDSFSRQGGEGFWSTQEEPCVWGWGEILPPQAWAGNSQENTMAFSPAACVLLHTLRDEPAPRMSPQLHKREKRTKKRKKAVPMLHRCFFLSVAQRILPVTISLLLFLSLSSFGAGQSMQMALFPAWQTTCLCSPHKGLQPQAFR